MRTFHCQGFLVSPVQRGCANSSELVFVRRKTVKILLSIARKAFGIWFRIRCTIVRSSFTLVPVACTVEAENFIAIFICQWEKCKNVNWVKSFVRAPAQLVVRRFAGKSFSGIAFELIFSPRVDISTFEWLKSKIVSVCCFRERPSVVAAEILHNFPI